MLEDLGVERFAARVGDDPKDGKVHLDAGDPIDCDLLLDCSGYTCHAGALLERAETDGVGRIAAEPTLLAKNYKSVFVIGDSLAIPDGRVQPPGGVQHAEACASTVVHNVTSVLMNKPPVIKHTWSSNLSCAVSLARLLCFQSSIQKSEVFGLALRS